MSNSLAQEHCQPCSIGTGALPSEEVNRLISYVPRWKRIMVGNRDRIQREFHFVDFVEGFNFACRIAELAEAENHHPSLLIEWGKVTVNWWTHKVNGLHQNDFIMAAKTDLLAAPPKTS
jgi:4a-hydroxytetrahydrobiopterin dehydratase